ncbi:MAG: GNAT family N-acetyltransferase [Thermotogaceae bacterium]|nr:GNAT family N-acetyltransferase [Thermotogaceae bacterium]
MDIQLNQVTRDTPELETALALIKGFWWQHSQQNTSQDEALGDFEAWTAEGHAFYLVMLMDQAIGFAHLGSRGAGMDWLEDLFILPEYQGQGFGSQVIRLLEKSVSQYSQSLYLEVAASNLDALRLYHRLGYDCLNTLTIRKDFHRENLRTIALETVAGLQLDIREKKP